MKSTITLNNEKSIEVPFEVLNFKQVENTVVVITNPKNGYQYNNENVYGFDLDGRQLWQIENLDLFHEQHDYTSIYFEESELCLYNRCGVEVKIVANTGEVLSSQLIK